MAIKIFLKTCVCPKIIYQCFLFLVYYLCSMSPYITLFARYCECLQTKSTVDCAVSTNKSTVDCAKRQYFLQERRTFYKP